MKQCRHGCDYAVAHFITPEGCVCFPEDKEQDLCVQHIIRDGMLGPDIKCVEIYIPELAEQWGIRLSE